MVLLFVPLITLLTTLFAVFLLQIDHAQNPTRHRLFGKRTRVFNHRKRFYQILERRLAAHRNQGRNECLSGCSVDQIDATIHEGRHMERVEDPMDYYVGFSTILNEVRPPKALGLLESCAVGHCHLGDDNEDIKGGREHAHGDICLTTATSPKLQNDNSMGQGQDDLYAPAMPSVPNELSGASAQVQEPDELETLESPPIPPLDCDSDDEKKVDIDNRKPICDGVCFESVGSRIRNHLSDNELQVYQLRDKHRSVLVLKLAVAIAMTSAKFILDMPIVFWIGIVLLSGSSFVHIFASSHARGLSSKNSDHGHSLATPPTSGSGNGDRARNNGSSSESGATQRDIQAIRPSKLPVPSKRRSLPLMPIRSLPSATTTHPTKPVPLRRAIEPSAMFQYLQDGEAEAHYSDRSSAAEHIPIVIPPVESPPVSVSRLVAKFGGIGSNDSTRPRDGDDKDRRKSLPAPQVRPMTPERLHPAAQGRQAPSNSPYRPIDMRIARYEAKVATESRGSEKAWKASGKYVHPRARNASGSNPESSTAVLGTLEGNVPGSVPGTIGASPRESAGTAGESAWK